MSSPPVKGLMAIIRGSLVVAGLWAIGLVACDPSSALDTAATNELRAPTNGPAPNGPAPNGPAPAPIVNVGKVGTADDGVRPVGNVAKVGTADDGVKPVAGKDATKGGPLVPKVPNAPIPMPPKPAGSAR